METTTQRNVWGIVLGALAILAIIGGIIWATTGEPNTVQNSTNSDASQKGDLYVGFTDATADIKNVNDIAFEVEKVEVYSAEQGWVTVSDEPMTFNLLELKNAAKTEFYAKANLDAGTYERVRITLGDVTVKTKANGDVKAFIPGRYVVMNLDMNVAADSATNVALDVLADKSLHMASGNKYVFAPVIEAQATSGAQVAVSSSNELTATGGTSGSASTVGMDLSGSSVTNFNLNSQNNLRVDDTQGTVRFMLGGQTFVFSDQTQNEAVTPEQQQQNQQNQNNQNQNQNGTGTQENNNSTIDAGAGVNGSLDANLQY